MWGKGIRGVKTRTPKKYSNVFIVSRRKKEIKNNFMSRSLKKGPYIYEKLLKKSAFSNLWTERLSKLGPGSPKYRRNDEALLLACTTARTSSEVEITEDMIGHRLGEFSPTRRKFVKHGGKMPKKLKPKEKESRLDQYASNLSRRRKRNNFMKSRQN